MAAELKSLEDLTTWSEYLEFMKLRLKQLPSGENRVFLSKKKLDFDENGKPYKGRALLIGPKGEIAAKKLKQAGIQFFEGSCQANGKELAIEGIEKNFLKGAALTLKRMKLGYKIAGVDDSSDEDDSPDDDAAAATAGAAGATAEATTDAGLLRRRLETLVAEIKRIRDAGTPETEPFIKQARTCALEANSLIVSNPARAAELLTQGEELIRLGGTGGKGDATSKEALELEKDRKALLAEVEAAKKLGEPANKGVLDSSEKALTETVLAEIAKKEYDKARARLDAVENAMAMLVEGPEPAGDPDLTVLDDWKAYRNFLKVQLKKVPKEGGPGYISRQPQDFSIDGKEFKGNAILFGPKAKIAVAALKRYGTLFMEGTLKVEGTALKIGGIKKSLLKGAQKTMLKLRLGKRIVADGVLPAEDETSDAAGDGSTGKKALDKMVKEIAESLVKLRDEIDKQKKAVPGMKKDAEDKRKKSDDLIKDARKKSEAGTDTQKDWDDATKALQTADAAHYGAKSAEREAKRAEESLREMTERLHQIRDSADSDSDKKTKLQKLKSDIAGKQLDASIANIDPKDPKAGKVIADQIKKRFGVSFKLNETKIMGRDAQGKQIFKDNHKKIDPKKEAETLKELYLTLSKAPEFPKSHLKKLTVSLRPANSESEGGVYFGGSKSAEITCRRPGESFNYGDQLNSRSAFPGGVDENCKAANSDPVNYFDWATLHEVAHAVDAKKGFMNGKMSGAKFGNWIEYENKVGPLAKIVSDHFGGSLAADAKKKLDEYTLKRIKAAPKGGPAPTTPEETKVQQWVDAVRHTQGLWWDGAQSAALAIGGRVYQEAYGFGGGWWNSYALSARSQGIHGYQFRAPGEWFAELYAAYYSDKLKPSHPIVSDLAALEPPK